MGDFSKLVEETLHSYQHLSKRHVHPRLQKMFELGGINPSFNRAEGAYVWDTDGNRYLDLLAGGGVYFMGRNHPRIHEALIDVLQMNLPNMSVVNASVLGGLVAERLIGLAGDHFGKVVFANSGSESNEVAIRFARQITRRRRYLYLEGAFHGRSYGAVSVCGFPQMREGIDPAMPTCTPIRPNDLRQLKRELAHEDVAGFILEPVQGMTGEVLEPEYLREAENLCRQHGTVLIVDEVQTGLGRTGSWFASRAAGVRPDIMTVSKALSGGAAPVAAVLVSDEIYEKVYSGFSSNLFYFSTFAENNLSMAASLATLDVLEDLDAPNEAARKGALLREGLEDLAARWDCVERVTGKGLMQTIYFRDSARPSLAIQQKLMGVADPAAFAASVHVDLYARQRVIAQLPGPGKNAIKVLPPVVCTDEDIAYFLASLEDTLAGMYGSNGPVVSLGRGILSQAVKKARQLVPAEAPSLVDPALAEKKKNPRPVS